MNQESQGGVGDWLRERCREENLSFRQAAQKTGLSHATIADITGGGHPSPRTILRLAEGFAGDGHNLRNVLEEKLLTLAGYRTVRPEEEPSEPLAQLLDKLTGLSASKMGMVGQFIDFINTLKEE